MVEVIHDGLRWHGIDWDEEPVFQSRGVERHRADALRLLAQGSAYRDFSRPEELQRLREEDPGRVLRYPRERAEALAPGEMGARAAAGEPHAIRFRVPDGETAWEDIVHGETRFRNDQIEDLVLLRTDGTPTYNLAVASDDAEMRITHVIRGDDHISNTPKQILIHRALGWEPPAYAHVPMILGSDGKRLSKRHGATAVGDYSDEGILPEAMVNFLALLGWSPGTDEEVLSRSELIARFSLDRVLRKSSVFDPKKLDWLNGQHLARLPLEVLGAEVVERLGPARAEGLRRFEGERDRFLALLDLLRSRARTVADLADQTRICLSDPVVYEEAAVKKHWEKDPEVTAGHLEALGEALSTTSWEPAALEGTLREVAERRGISGGALIHPLRVALTGQTVSPGIFELFFLLGRETGFTRIGAAVAWLRKG
jgi:glutamyl-tRNA synthetase